MTISDQRVIILSASTWTSIGFLLKPSQLWSTPEEIHPGVFAGNGFEQGPIETKVEIELGTTNVQVSTFENHNIQLLIYIIDLGMSDFVW